MTRDRAYDGGGRTLTLFGLAILLALASMSCRAADPHPGPPSSGASEAPDPPHPVVLPSLAELPSFETDLSVDQAYAAIPHRQTEFDFAGSKLGGDEAAYLGIVFHLVDDGIRLRVTAYRDLYRSGATGHREIEQLGELADVLAAIEPPPRLHKYHELVLEALADQRAFLAEWEGAGASFAYRDRIGAHPRVRSASTALQRAYGVLKAIYGAGESARNRDAFFDYHCALDFL